MRIRKKPYAKTELENSNFYIKKPEENKGKWNQIFAKKQPFYLELGCGKGVFTAEFAVQNTNINILAIDLISEMLLLTKQNIEEKYLTQKIDNILITSYNIEQILNIIDNNDKIDRIYINLCNPWPKAGHKKRRLTHTRQLEKYKTFLISNGEIHFKTDDSNLFNESIKYFEESGFEIEYKTFDLYSENIINNITTEHEIMFVQKGIKIKKLIAKKI